MMSLQITIVGSGYMGLTTGLCFASIGHFVTCFDVDAEKIERLATGHCPFFEPGLSDLLQKTLTSGNVRFTSDPREAMRDARIVFFAVPTPEGAYGKADISFLKAACESCAPYLSQPTLFVNKSTAPVGTVTRTKEWLKTAAPHGSSFTVAANPEFLSEGHAIDDFLHPSRVVIGTEDAESAQLLAELHAPILSDGHNHPIISTTIPGAELIKYASNAFLALKISFINEIADFAEIVGADIVDIAKGIGYDTRIGHQFLQAGIGYGGSCFGKDVKALAKSGEEHGYEFKIIKALATVNDLRYQIVLKKLKKYYPDLRNTRIAVLGLSYKPDTDDVRDSPSHRIIHELLDGGAQVRVYDPEANTAFQKSFPRAHEITLAPSAYDAAQEADALLLLTAWKEFASLNFQTLKAAMRNGLIVDGRNVFQRKDAESAGFSYEGVGR